MLANILIISALRDDEHPAPFKFRLVRDSIPMNYAIPVQRSCRLSYTSQLVLWAVIVWIRKIPVKDKDEIAVSLIKKRLRLRQRVR